jgi:hypothetical protein
MMKPMPIRDEMKHIPPILKISSVVNNIENGIMMRKKMPAINPHGFGFFERILR